MKKNKLTKAITTQSPKFFQLLLPFLHNPPSTPNSQTYPKELTTNKLGNQPIPWRFDIGMGSSIT